MSTLCTLYSVYMCIFFFFCQVSLEDMYNGSTRQLALQKNVICSKCEGRGGKKVCIADRICFENLPFPQYLEVVLQ